jgi:predicted metalloprotease with PDZ domain
MARLILAICIGLLIGAGRPTLAEPPADPARSAPSSQDSAELESPLRSHQTAVADGEVRDLVRQLGSSSFAERQLAMERLSALCPEAFDALAECYRASDDFETRIRIQDLVERAFFNSRLLQQSGFLGVAPQPVNSNLDSRLAPGRGGILVQHVVEKSAASQAGIEIGDLLFEIDEQPFPEDLRSDDFSEEIREAGPGAQMRFSLYRVDEVTPIVVTATLGARPLKHYNDSENAQRLEETARQFRQWWAQKFEDENPDRMDPTGLPDGE